MRHAYGSELLDYLKHITDLEPLYIDSSEVSRPALKKIALSSQGLFLWVPKDTDYKRIVHLKRFIDYVLEIQETSAKHAESLDFLKSDVEKVFKNYQQHLKTEVDEYAFKFLNDQMTYALLEDETLIINNGLDDHTLKTSVMKLGKQNAFEVAVKDGELYGYATTHYKIVVLSQGKITEIQKGLINVRIIMMNNDYENRRYVKALQKNQELLERQDKLKNEFLANTTHELKTPIHSIIGLADSLIDGATGPLSADTLQNLEMITFSGRRLKQMIDDVLDFSKLKSEEVNLKVGSIDLKQLTEVILMLLKPTIGDKNLSLINDVKDHVYVTADEDRLQQILFNLIGNAIKFTRQGEVHVGAKANDDGYEVYIKDSGIGIAQENQSRIFRSFEQADGGISREFGGTGLGLSITKFLVEMHGGKIWCESALGMGTTFYFTLAKADIPTESRHAVAIGPLMPTGSVASEDNDVVVRNKALNHRNRQGKILVVDDEKVNIQLLVNQLTLANYEVSSAANGIIALDMIEKDQYDLVLLDVMMPKLSGYEVCRILRKTYSNYELPILILTAKNQPHDIITGFEVGANDYLTKPFEKSEMLARVKTLLELKKSVAEAIENAVLANTDVLTDLDSRRHLFNRGYSLFETAKRASTDLSVLMMDIDHLKRINDLHGHDIGDEVIKAIALNIRASLRENDIVGRYGGEEFTAILPDTDEAEAIVVAERVLEAVRSIDIRSKGVRIDSSISIGLATLAIHDSLESLIRAADNKLYEAKRNGRNRFEF